MARVRANKLGHRRDIRQSLFLNPSFRKKPEVIQAILDVVQHRNLRRDRQSFVMLLGFTGAAKHAASVASFAKDPDIQGSRC
nr:putative integron gene cassette protein [uncultured bacterium]